MSGGSRSGRCALWAAGAMAIGYVVLASVVSTWPRSSLDVAVATVVQRATPLDPALRAASAFGGWIWSVLAIAALFAARARREAITLSASMLGAVAIEHATKLVFSRPRPTAPLLIIREPVTGPGFPSGHVLDYVALFGLLAVFAAVRARIRAVRVCAITAAVVLVVLVGPSRVYLGAHWPSDVLAAYLAGGAWLVLVARFYLLRRAEAA